MRRIFRKSQNQPPFDEHKSASLTQSLASWATDDKQFVGEQMESMSVYQVSPRLTDRAIDNWLDPHYVAVSSSSLRQNKLLLFLSGSYGKPGRQILFMQEAVRLGYHAINLSYPNSWTVLELCKHCQDVNCHEKVRLEIVDGIKRSDKVDISPSNCIQNRLVKLLLYLDQRQPEENWLQYLEQNSPQWSSIIVAGHSQGGGHAAMIAKEYEVARLVMLAAPADYSPALQSLSPWLAAPTATPKDRYYGFVHIKDPGFVRVQQAWNLLGMTAYGSAINVDRQAIPYHHSHCLVTAATPSRPGKHHGSVVHDLHTPKLFDGQPRFKSVWHYLCTELS